MSDNILDGGWDTIETDRTDTGRQIRVEITVSELLAREIDDESLAKLMGMDGVRVVRQLLAQEDGEA